MSKPDWLTLRAFDPEALSSIKRLLDGNNLHTVCEDAACPNIGECFAGKTCTFMILGNICTRNCSFCAVAHGRPHDPDPDEPRKVAAAARKLGLRHVVVTSVTRDDLEDGGAGHFAATINALHALHSRTTVEVLIPDFQGRDECLGKVIGAKPDVINHNMETVPRLYSSVRPQARYERSLEVLGRVHEFGGGIISKSGLMLGLGEKKDEIIGVMKDLRTVHCDVLTLGQYLSPSSDHHPVAEYVSPAAFKEMEDIGYELGFVKVYAGPLVRSSYHADGIFSKTREKIIGKGNNQKYGKSRQI